jgi:hypothetical protein
MRWFFDEINEIGKLFAQLIKRERAPINKIRDGKVDIATDTTQIRASLENTVKFYILRNCKIYKKLINL